MAAIMESLNNSREEVTAALLVIGNEILSGRTKDKNIGFIASHCTGIGIRLKEVRVVADDEAAIISAVNALRNAYTYVFTTGGIGPTHDDITAGQYRPRLWRFDRSRSARRRPHAPSATCRTDSPRPACAWRASPLGAELIDNPFPRRPAS